MLTMTDKAAEMIRTLTSQPGVPEDVGLRMSVQEGEEGTLTLSLQSPQPDDVVIDDAGARVFIEQDAAPLVEDRALDAQVDDDGGLSFLLGSQPG